MVDIETVQKHVKFVNHLRMNFLQCIDSLLRQIFELHRIVEYPDLYQCLDVIIEYRLIVPKHNLMAVSQMIDIVRQLVDFRRYLHWLD